MGFLSRLFRRDSNKPNTFEPATNSGDSDDKPMISLVALRSKPIQFDEDDISTLAQSLWDFTLSPVDPEAGDFVIHKGPTHFVKAGSWIFFIHSFPIPYVENKEESVKDIEDFRVKESILQHNSWTSVDALNIPEHSTKEEAYRRIGRMLAELIDDECVAILDPESGRGIPINPFTLEDARQALRQDDPRAALAHLANVPVVHVKADDARMQAAVLEAQDRWPEFVSAFRAGTTEYAAVKAPVTVSGNTEFIWIEVTHVDEESIQGTLANDPVQLGALREGDSVTVPVTDLNDWMIIQNGKMLGGFTVKLLAPDLTL